MIRYIFLLLGIISINKFTFAQDSISLQQKAAQMLIVGFRGTELKSSNSVYNDIVELHIGGVILFDYDTPSKTRPRNIRSVKQLKKLIFDLQKLAGGSLFISIDQEGGYVNRLKVRNGFPLTRTAQYIGRLNNTDSTTFWATQTALTLHNLGFNLNFAPNVDVNINPKSPAVGKVQCSFSSKASIVTKHAQIWINEQNKYGIISAIKHFPGHGSANTDSHIGLVDVTNTWSKEELLPFKILIDSGNVDMVMTSHMINRNLDSVPATFSRYIITQLLREELGFKGVVVSDDIAMGAVVNYYTLERAVEMAINAGVDILVLSNNGKIFDSKIASKVVEIICELVNDGKIRKSTVDAAYKRIISLKQKQGLIKYVPEIANTLRILND